MITGRPAGVDAVIGEDFISASARMSVDKIFFPHLTPETARALLNGEEVRFGSDVAGEVEVSAIGGVSKERKVIGEWPVQGRLDVKKDDYAALHLYRGNEAMLANMSDVIRFKSDSVKATAKSLITEKLMKSCEKIIDLEETLNIGRKLTQKELSAVQAVKDYGFDYIIDPDSGKFLVSFDGASYSAENQHDTTWQSEMYLDGIAKPLIAAVDICQGIEREMDKHLGLDSYNQAPEEKLEVGREMGL